CHPQAASAAPSNACSSSEPMLNDKLHSVAAPRRARSRIVKVTGEGLTWANNLPCWMAAIQMATVVQRSGVNPNLHAQTWTRVCPSDSPHSPYKQSASPIADAE